MTVLILHLYNPLKVFFECYNSLPWPHLLVLPFGFAFLFSLQIVYMEMYGLFSIPMYCPIEDVWRCASKECGAQSLMTLLTPEKEGLSADSLVTLTSVRQCMDKHLSGPTNNYLLCLLSCSCQGVPKCMVWAGDWASYFHGQHSVQWKRTKAYKLCL